jgi:hypothetical protein
MVVGERPTSSTVTISLERLLKIRGIKKGLNKEDKAAITIESSTSPACAKRKKKWKKKEGGESGKCRVVLLAMEAVMLLATSKTNIYVYTSKHTRRRLED